jgi:hypothetical protein
MILGFKIIQNDIMYVLILYLNVPFSLMLCNISSLLFTSNLRHNVVTYMLCEAALSLGSPVLNCYT